MKKGDFVGGMEVQPLGGGQVMILGGDPDNWVCTWQDNGTTMKQTFQPEQLQSPFAWLDDLENDQWELLGPEGSQVLSRSFDLTWFKDRCGPGLSDNWRVAFDIWGESRPRRYRNFPRPPVAGLPAILIEAQRLIPN